MKIISPTNPIYVKACKRESEFWSGMDAYEYSNIPQRVQKYENKKRTGDENIDEVSYLKTLGTSAHGLSIGSGGGTYELGLMQQGIVEHFVFIDISDSALTTLRNNAEAMGLSDRIETRVQDFNFLALPEKKYDMVCCRNMLHHIINLEECIHEINKSLTDTGIFVIDEAISENKMYWSDEKMAFIHTLQTMLQENGIETKQYIRTNPKVLTNTCPFECVRSSDLYDIIQHYFQSTAIRNEAYGALFSFWNGITSDTSDTFFDILEEFDTFVAQHNYLRPNRLFGIYKKSTAHLMHSTPWSEKELEENIGVNSFNERSLMNWSEKIHKTMPGLYNLLKRLYFKIR